MEKLREDDPIAWQEPVCSAFFMKQNRNRNGSSDKNPIEKKKKQ